MPSIQEQYNKLAITQFTNTNVLSKPDLKSIGNKVLNAYASTVGLQLTDDTDYNYWTTPPSEMHRIKYFKYSDFRTRRPFLQRRQDGANAALNGVISAIKDKDGLGDRIKKSFKAAKYYASSFIPGGTYTIINLSSPAALGYGWGIHTTPSLIKDFTLQSSILNTITNSNNIENLNESVSKVVNEYFSKNQNEFNQSLVAEFVDSFNTNLQTQITNLQNNSTSDFDIVQNINNVISDVQNIYESKQAEISQIILCLNLIMPSKLFLI